MLDKNKSNAVVKSSKLNVNCELKLGELNH